jgi:hypothetical protein
MCSLQIGIEVVMGIITNEPRYNFNYENAWAISREMRADSDEWILLI